MNQLSEKRFELRKYGDSWEVYDNETFECYTIHNVSDLLNKLAEENEELGISIKLFEDDIATKDKKIDEQQSTIDKLRKILAEAEDTIEVRLAEHYLKEYENIKHNIIGDNDE